MLHTLKTDKILLDLDKAFRFVVTLVWDDLVRVASPQSVRVEYMGGPEASLDHVSIWSARAGGYQDLICDYWTWASSAHPCGIRFENQHHSEKLAQALDFIMKNQDRFTRPRDACCHGLVLVYPPDADDRREATTWMKAILGPESERGVREVPIPPEDLRQDEEAWSRMDWEGDPNFQPKAA